jgi:DNA-binding LacI/PurR family transcriptional regulator
MAGLRFLSKIEQVAAHLRAELAGGRWEGAMPGRVELAAELRMNDRTVEQALRLLEREGVLVPQGAGRRRLIALEKKPVRTSLKVRILRLERIDQGLAFQIDLLHRLREAGHTAAFAEKSLQDLGMNVKRVAAYVKTEGADAWIVCAGPREILEWFATQPAPAFAMFGKLTGLPLPGIRVDKIPAIKTAVRRLYEHGHRRIVLMMRQDRLKPHAGPGERAFLDELSALGIATGPFNLPNWGDDIAGFHRCLDSLFQHTPPSALLLDEAPFFIAAQQHLARMGKAAPRDVSLICDDPDIAFSWCDPPVSHIRWDSRPVVSRMVRWADRVARGEEDKSQRSALAEFVEGGTIGPAAG